MRGDEMEWLIEVRVPQASGNHVMRLDSTLRWQGVLHELTGSDVINLAEGLLWESFCNPTPSSAMNICGPRTKVLSSKFPYFPSGGCHLPPSAAQPEKS